MDDVVIEQSFTHKQFSIRTLMTDITNVGKLEIITSFFNRFQDHELPYARKNSSKFENVFFLRLEDIKRHVKRKPNSVVQSRNFTKVRKYSSLIVFNGPLGTPVLHCIKPKRC